MPQSTADLALDPNPMILIVGDSGMHKTYFLGTCPDPYVFAFDGPPTILRHRKPPIDYDIFKDTPSGGGWVPRKQEGYYKWGQAWQAFVQRLNLIGADMDKGTNPYKVLGFDSVTTMADCAMAYILMSDGHSGAPQIQHWGAQIQLMSKVFDQMNAWPVTKVFTAHIQRNQNDLTQVIEMLPLITGKLAGKIGVYFDEVWYVEYDKQAKDDARWRIQVSPGAFRKQSKTRYGVPDNTPLHWDNVKQFLTEQTGEK
jgi:hypothetical protein